MPPGWCTSGSRSGTSSLHPRGPSDLRVYMRCLFRPNGRHGPLLTVQQVRGRPTCRAGGGSPGPEESPIRACPPAALFSWTEPPGGPGRFWRPSRLSRSRGDQKNWFRVLFIRVLKTLSTIAEFSRFYSPVARERERTQRRPGSRVAGCPGGCLLALGPGGERRRPCTLKTGGSASGASGPLPTP